MVEVTGSSPVSPINLLCVLHKSDGDSVGFFSVFEILGLCFESFYAGHYSHDLKLKRILCLICCGRMSRAW